MPGIISGTPEPVADDLRPRIGTQERGGDITPVGTHPNMGGDPMGNTMPSGHVPPVVVGPQGDAHIDWLPK